jgi:hypothetical protein
MTMRHPSGVALSETRHEIADAEAVGLVPFL